MTITIHYDNYTESPREWCNLGTIVAAHHRYNLSDVAFPQAGDHGSLLDDFKTYLANDQSLTLSDVIYLPVYMYEHSGIAISSTPFNCRWDSGQLGFIYVTKQQIYKDYSVKRISPKLLATITNILNNELELYDHYLQGYCYEYRIYDNNECIDSCGGFLGELKDIKIQIREQIDPSLWKQLDAIKYEDIID